MAEFPKLPLWTDAYLADTNHLSTTEHGAYLLLLIAMWRVKGNRLPSDDHSLAKFSRLTAAQWARIKPTIMEFFDDEGGFITQGRLTDEAVAVRRQCHRQSDKAKARWLKTKGPDANPALPRQYRNDASLSLSHKEEEKSPTPTLRSSPESLDPAQGFAAEKSADTSHKKPSAKGTRLPAEWTLPKAWGDWAIGQKIPEAAIRLEADRFADFWHAKAGKDAAKLDWLATWRNWIRTARDRPASRRNGHDISEIPDAQPVRLEPRSGDFDAAARPGAADLPGVQREPEAKPPEDSLPVGDEDEGWLADLLPPLRTHGSG